MVRMNFIRALFAVCIALAFPIFSAATYGQYVPKTLYEVNQDSSIAEHLTSEFAGLLDEDLADMEEEWRSRFILLAVHFYEFYRTKSVSSEEAKEILLLGKSDDVAVKLAATNFSFYFVFLNSGMNLPGECPRFIETMNEFRRAFLQLVKDDPAFLSEYYRCSLLFDTDLTQAYEGGSRRRFIESEALRGWWEDTESSKLWFQCGVILTLYRIGEEHRISRFLELKTETQMVGFLRCRYLWLLAGEAIGMVLEKDEYRWRTPIGPAGFFHIGYASAQWVALRHGLLRNVLKGEVNKRIKFSWYRRQSIPYDDLVLDVVGHTNYPPGLWSMLWLASTDASSILWRVRHQPNSKELEEIVQELRMHDGRVP